MARAQGTGPRGPVPAGVRTFDPVAKLGADDLQLDRFADTCDTVALTFDRARVEIGGGTTRAFWLGPDGDTFRHAWTSQHGPRLAAAARLLEGMAKEVRRQAEAQRQASAGADVALVPGGGPTVGPNGGPPAGGPTTAPAPPGASPEQVREWWRSLSPAQQQAALDQQHRTLGNLDGLPASVRDDGNRRALHDDLRRLEAEERAGTLSGEERDVLEHARHLRDYLATVEARRDPITGEPVGAQLYIYEPGAYGGDGRAAVATGDLDTAEHVAVTVPGMFTTVQGMSPGRPGNVYEEARWASGDGVAVLDWVGYDAPSGDPVTSDLGGVVNQSMAREGARVLAADVAGLRASRTDPAHLTVAGNSYGSTTSAIAADEFGLQADDVILTGSPGAGDADDAADLTTGREHTWVGSNSKDFVSQLGTTGWSDPSGGLADEVPGVELLGNDPAEDDFDANRFQAEDPRRGDVYNLEDHKRYYDQDTESLFNVGAIVGGEYDLVLPAEDRHDPWYAPMQDPEADRTPTMRTHERR